MTVTNNSVTTFTDQIADVLATAAA